MNRFEKRKKAIEQAIAEKIAEYKAIYKKADDEDRDPTDDERLDIESHLKAIETLKTEKEEVEANIKTLDHVDSIGKALGPVSQPTITVGQEPADRLASELNRHFAPMAKSLGQQFVESEGYKAAINLYRESGRFPSGFSTGQIPLEMKGTLGETAGSGGSALVSIPYLVPGVTETLFQKLTVASLIGESQTNTNNVRYVVEGTATSGAAGVAEGGTKPESTLGLTTTDEPIKKIATLLPVAEEMLEDVPAIQGYINGRLVLFVQIEEERQLLRGTSGGAEVQGILTSRSVPVYAGGTAAGDKATQLFKAMNGQRGSAFVEPEWIIINPTDWQDIRLAKDTNGQFYGGGPFLGTYGAGGPVGLSGQVQGPQDQIWNKPTYVTGVLGAGTALVGSSSSAMVFRRGGISVEATNSHASYFALNLVAIRAEERLGLAVFRPKGFVEVRLA